MMPPGLKRLYQSKQEALAFVVLSTWTHLPSSHLYRHRFIPVELLHVDVALASRSEEHNSSFSQGHPSHCQKLWDAHKVSSILESARDAQAKARLQAASVKESGAWLNAFPISALSLRIDDETVRVAVGLCLGTQLCHPHSCCRCGTAVDRLGIHGLSCRKSKGHHHHHHSELNDIVHWALTTAHIIPSRLEAASVLRSDGKRPDGTSVVPWQRGKLIVWVTTCSVCSVICSNAASGDGLVVAAAEGRKKIKY